MTLVLAHMNNNVRRRIMKSEMLCIHLHELSLVIFPDANRNRSYMMRGTSVLHLLEECFRNMIL